MRILDTALEVLGSYNPFWLRLGLEVVVGRAVAVAVGASRGPRGQVADLERFVREQFLNDPELAYEGATNKTIDGLYTDQYWVASPPPSHTYTHTHFYYLSSLKGGYCQYWVALTSRRLLPPPPQSHTHLQSSTLSSLKARGLPTRPLTASTSNGIG